MSLFDECIEALGEDVQVFSDNNREQILSNFESSFPFKWGRIEWENVSNYAEVNTIDEIIYFIDQNVDEYSNVVYVIWDEGTLPIIKSTLDKIFKVIDDVTAVSFDTWIFCPSTGYVIEIFHDGEVKVGFK
ncbi:hypothetical protein P4637_09435 [Halalkalibacterium halodurans]|uniref:CDI toxin immunity protein n=1 Tax=Halalkalibacterium halodurans TaxID=86665 RepID=UPI002AA98DAA|nr:hypothetical protein [Halalkalibacterium halodurans]MDY7224204.1 hypothetical protein [Halalkalibacterium halodurans]MDY7243489.1 hypothetical protein [Halalkalibacterium halodurans]MED4079442.1 hypothetical protein [Halalkalibacterium halodurans]MED4085057.1 hypothetical protein [Halalkalibacterium halodurans]MED4105930.1 hypothetical protein [Halalkalibacterium halodurans]